MKAKNILHGFINLFIFAFFVAIGIGSGYYTGDYRTDREHGSPPPVAPVRPKKPEREEGKNQTACTKVWRCSVDAEALADQVEKAAPEGRIVAATAGDAGIEGVEHGRRDDAVAALDGLGQQPPEAIRRLRAHPVGLGRDEAELAAALAQKSQACCCNPGLVGKRNRDWVCALPWYSLVGSLGLVVVV